MQQYVLVLDFGAQYTQLIARRVREQGVFTIIKPYYTPIDELKTNPPKAVILSGGPSCVNDPGAPLISADWFNLGVPVLGICYGMQLAAAVLGGTVGKGISREFGPAALKVLDNNDLFYGLENNNETRVWMSHGDHVEVMPKGFQVLASSIGAPVSAFADRNRKVYGIQFHPEVVHTEKGQQILSNFILRIAKAEPNWNPQGFIEESVEKIRNSVPKDAQVICGLSGGVDSTVAAVLVSRAIGDRLHCIMVNNGLLRKSEVEEIEHKLGRAKGGLGLNLTVVDAKEQFLNALKGVSDPEKKRKIIGRVFIDVFEQEARRIQNVSHLVQGTLYPDVIESVSVHGPSATIKTHHNVGGLPERMQLKLIEPLRELFKDEVRRFGAELAIEKHLLWRHPFPGPGLAVRCLGEITETRLEMLRQADAIFIEEIIRAGIYDQIWQAFAVLLPVKSVGVMGDYRTYEESIALRAVTSDDGMTANWVMLPEELLRRVSTRIINETKGINRVVLDISSKPPATIEWE